MKDSVKIRLTLFTDEKIVNLQWSKEKTDKILKAENFYLDYGVDTLTIYFTPSRLGKAISSIKPFAALTATRTYAP